MSCKVNEGDDLGGGSADVHPVQAPCKEEGERGEGGEGQGGEGRKEKGGWYM